MAPAQTERPEGSAQNRRGAPKSGLRSAEVPRAVHDPFADLPSPDASSRAAQVLAVGHAASWPDWLERLVGGGFRVEVVPDAERAFLRSVERSIDLVLVDAETAAEACEAFERLRRLSPCTRLLIIGDGSERGARTRPEAAASDDPVRAISATLSAKAFEREAQAAVKAARIARERRERIDQLRSLVQRVQDPTGATGDLSRLMQQLPEESASAPMAFDTLRQSIASELDALHAARETCDYIARCLPRSIVAVWLAGPGHHIGLAACGGEQGDAPDAVVRLLSRLERLHLPDQMTSGGIVSTDDAASWAQSDDRDELEGRWAMIAPCRADGRCHAAILLLGPRGRRPLPAQAALDAVRLMLGDHLARIERVNLRGVPDWPAPDQEPCDLPDDPGQD